MTNKQNTPSPLWRVLNERRTKGTLKVMQEITPNNGYSLLNQSDYTTFANITTLTKSGSAEANAAFTALAVNHFANLAEALEWIENEIKTTPDALADALDGMILLKIKQALKPIS